MPGPAPAAAVVENLVPEDMVYSTKMFDAMVTDVGERRVVFRGEGQGGQRSVLQEGVGERRLVFQGAGEPRPVETRRPEIAGHVQKTFVSRSETGRRELARAEVEVATAARIVDVASAHLKVEPKVKYVGVRMPDVRLDDQQVEIPYVVQVPKVSLVETTENWEFVTPVDVQHTRTVEKARQVVEVQEVQKTVEVPNNVTERVIRQKPRFVSLAGGAYEQGYLQQGFALARPVDANFHTELEAVSEKIQSLEDLRGALSQQLADRVNTINGLQQDVFAERRKKAELAVHLQNVDTIVERARFTKQGATTTTTTTMSPRAPMGTLPVATVTVPQASTMGVGVAAAPVQWTATSKSVGGGGLVGL